MNSLADLPTLQEIRDLDSINRELELESPEIEVALNSGAESEDSDKQSADTASTGESMEPAQVAAQDSGEHAHTPESAAEPQTGEDCEVEKVDNQA